ncbi:MAG: hypothetical protein FD155_327 [Bacteroidetes bacterium]|nr:MAG: hypothetical protein FD155_327 [Bacteroidota bacterium]
MPGMVTNFDSNFVTILYYIINQIYKSILFGIGFLAFRNWI